MTNESRIFNGQRIISSINGVGKTGQPQDKTDNFLMPYTDGLKT